jgi:hypothetical protein
VWGSNGGHYPSIAYQTALAIILALQLLAFVWFVGSELFAAEWRFGIPRLESSSASPEIQSRKVLS